MYILFTKPQFADNLTGEVSRPVGFRYVGRLNQGAQFSSRPMIYQNDQDNQLWVLGPFDHEDRTYKYYNAYKLHMGHEQDITKNHS